MFYSSFWIFVKKSFTNHESIAFASSFESFKHFFLRYMFKFDMCAQPWGHACWTIECGPKKPAVCCPISGQKNYSEEIDSARGYNTFLSYKIFKHSSILDLNRNINRSKLELTPNGPNFNGSFPNCQREGGKIQIPPTPPVRIYASEHFLLSTD